ncbi:hypothetical protein [Qipengyuania citrea]|uniref:hypothetical protein n=1 Tax=Qipengyuania citrea TaxID=225971 RepID=UPI0032972DDD
MSASPAYQRMLSARDVVRARLSSLEAQLRYQAEKTVRSPAAHRGDSGWRKCDEAEYRNALAALQHSHRKDIGALRAKLDRQQAAIRAHVARHGSFPSA